MENFNFDGTITLNLSEMMAIDGGSKAYDAGYEIGKGIRDFFEGFWDGLTGQ